MFVDGSRRRLTLFQCLRLHFILPSSLKRKGAFYLLGTLPKLFLMKWSRLLFSRNQNILHGTIIVGDGKPSFGES
uniref:Uncharacterized protein n=2 Tax=Musa acuminata subsp. malaccensis TaxID=214687 RepID=A0A804K219_MUSAM